MKLYVLGSYDSDDYKLADLVWDRQYFADADAALKSVRENVMDHLEGLYQDDIETIWPLDGFGAADFKAWMDAHHPDLWYPSSETDLTTYSGLFAMYLDCGRACYWVMTVEVSSPTASPSEETPVRR